MAISARDLWLPGAASYRMAITVGILDPQPPRHGPDWTS